MSSQMNFGYKKVHHFIDVEFYWWPNKFDISEWETTTKVSAKKVGEESIKIHFGEIKDIKWDLSCRGWENERRLVKSDVEVTRVETICG